MKIVEFATRRRVTILMVTVAIVLFGFVSLSRLKLNLLPDLSYPTLTVRTDLPGAAPLELETLITRPIEESVGIIRNVRSVRSVSRAGQADVILEFAWGTDMDLAGIDVREKIDLLQLPLEASRPILLRFDPSTEPVMRYAFVDTDEFAKTSPGEFEDHVGLAGARYGPHGADIADDADGFLDRPRDEGLEFQRSGAREVRAHRQRWIGQVGQQVQLQARKRHEAEQDDGDRHHQDRDPAPRGELDDLHRAPASVSRPRPLESSRPPGATRSSRRARPRRA